MAPYFVDEMVEPFCYKRTPDGDLNAYVHFPPQWQAGDNRPAIVFYFGGGWKKRNLEQFCYQADYLAARGMIAIRMDYRVWESAPLLPQKCVDDAQSALQWLRQNAKTLGVDASRIAVAGGSSGGHLAACLATTCKQGVEAESSADAIAPDLLVLLNPILDLTDEDRTQQVGGEDLAGLLSPNLHLHQAMPPALLCYGVNDPELDQGLCYFEQCQKLGVEVELFLWRDVTHAFFNNQPWKDSTLLQIDRFLSHHGYIEGPATLEVDEETDYFKVNLQDLPELNKKVKSATLPSSVRLAMYRLVQRS